MSNRNFDASFSTKRIRDLNVAQNLHNAFVTGQRVGNPITALNQVSLINQYRPGVQTIFQRGNILSESSIDTGGMANLLVPESISRGPRRVLPSRVIILGIDPEDRQLTIRFSPPTENASSIKNYKYSTDNGLTFRSLTPPQTTSAINIYGLLNVSNYDIILTPITDDGDVESSRLSVTEVKEGKGFTTPMRFALAPAFIKRLAKREKDKLSDSFVVKTLDGKLVRVKPVMITNTLSNGGVTASLIKTCRAICKEFINKTKFETVIADLVSYNFQKSVKENLHLVCPLRTFEIRTLEIETKKKSETVEEEMLLKLKREREKKEADALEETESENSKKDVQESEESDSEDDDSEEETQ